MNKDLLPADQRDPMVDFIIDKACEFTFTERREILSKNQEDEVVFIRHLIMFVIKETKPFLPLKTIAWHLNRRDHTTVLNGIKKISDLISFPLADRFKYRKIIDFKNEILIATKQLDGFEGGFNELLDRETEMYLSYIKIE